MIDTYYEYIFNCKTGKYTREEYERYNENAMDMPTLPPLKNSKKNKQGIMKKLRICLHCLF
ncbi:hypothetical protein [Capnocytophaga granulosa]